MPILCYILVIVYIGKTILRTSQTIDNDAGDPEEEDDLDGDRLHQHLSSSTPDIHSLEQHDQRDSGVSDETDVVQKFIKCAKSVCLVVEDFTPNHDEPSCIPLRVRAVSRHKILGIELQN